MLAAALEAGALAAGEPAAGALVAGAPVAAEVSSSSGQTVVLTGMRVVVLRAGQSVTLAAHEVMVISLVE